MDGIRYVSSCYKGGEGPPLKYTISNNKCVESDINPQYYTLEECKNMLKSNSKLKKNQYEIFIIVIITCIAILLLVILYFIFKKEKTFNSKKYKKLQIQL